MGHVTDAVLRNVVRGAFTALRASERTVFLDNNRYALAAMLERIFKHESAPATDRFLVVIMDEGPCGPSYVQCLFRGDNALIELSSGYYNKAPGEPPPQDVGPYRLKRLTKLGFTTDASEGNFQCLVDLRDGHPLETADLMLTALFDTYGAKPDAELCWESPFVRGYDYEEFLREGEED